MRHQTTSPPKPSAPPLRIVRLHRDLVLRFASYIHDPVVIGTDRNNSEGWKRVALTDDPVRFYMWNQPGNIGQIIAPRKGGRSASPVLCLNDSEDEVPWVAWHEEWIPSQHNRGQFEFKTASLSFFWGRASQEPEQIFRAEWVEPEYGSDNAATPHWHIDWMLADVDMYMSGIHLGMAGWESSGGGIKCWQKGVDGRWDDIVLWADRTLFYAKNQLEYFPLAL